MQQFVNAAVTREFLGSCSRADVTDRGVGVKAPWHLQGSQRASTPSFNFRVTVAPPLQGARTASGFGLLSTGGTSASTNASASLFAKPSKFARTPPSVEPNITERENARRRIFHVKPKTVIGQDPATGHDPDGSSEFSVALRNDATGPDTLRFGTAA